MDVSSGDIYEATMMLDQVDALMERYEVAGLSWSDITQSYKCWNGADTNGEPTYVMLTRTNRGCFLAFTNAGVVVQPYVTRALVVQLDTAMRAAAPAFVQYWEEAGGSFNTYFSTTNAGGSYPTNPPFCNAAAIMLHAGIGIVTNESYDIGAVTGGEAYFTRQPPVVHTWSLAEATYLAGTNPPATEAWVSQTIKPFDLRYYGSDGPVVRYFPGGTNAFTSVPITIQGVVLNTGSQSTNAYTETVSIVSTNHQLSTIWFSITNITCTNSAANNRDVLNVAYTGEFPLYGDAPYTLDAATLLERYKFIDALRWTFDGGSAATNFYAWNYGGWPDQDRECGFYVVSNAWTDGYTWEAIDYEGGYDVWLDLAGPTQTVDQFSLGMGRSKCDVTVSVNTNIGAQLIPSDVYWRFGAFGGTIGPHQFADVDGYGYQLGRYRLVDTFSGSESVEAERPVVIGNTIGDTSANPIDFDYTCPPSGSSYAYDNYPFSGWEYYGISYGIQDGTKRVVRKWDESPSTNGLQFVDQ